MELSFAQHAMWFLILCGIAAATIGCLIFTGPRKRGE